MLTALPARAARAHRLLGVSYRAMAAAMGFLDRESVSDAIRDYMREGKPLSPKQELRFRLYLEELEAAPEVVLYSYEPWAVVALLELRAAENDVRVRSRLANDDGDLAHVAESLFLTLARRVLGGRAAAVMISVDRSLTDSPTAFVYSNDYVAASTLMALAGLWLDFADMLAQLDSAEITPFDLDFSTLNVPTIESIFDVLERAYCFYARTEKALRALADAFQREVDEQKGKVATLSRANDSALPDVNDALRRSRAAMLAAFDDAAVAALNMVGLQSFGLEVLNLVDLASAKGWGAHIPLVDRSSRTLRGIDRAALAKAAALVDGSYAPHVLIHRNILHEAAQISEGPLVEKMLNHIAAILKIEPSEVWTYRICGRKPLADEGPVNTYYRAWTAQATLKGNGEA